MRFMPAPLFLSLMCAYGQVTIQVGGKQVGTTSTLNFTNAGAAPGSGIVQWCGPGDGRVDCSVSYNTALVATHDSVHRNANYCDSSTGTAQYTCSLPFKRLTQYQPGMTFVLRADTTCAAACSLNIDNLGVKSLKKADGATDPAGAITAGQPQWVFFDGAVFRMLGAGGAVASSAGVGETDQRGDVRARRVIGAMDAMAYASTINLDVTAGDLHKTTTINSAGNAIVNATTGGLPGQHMWIIIANDQISGKTITFGTNFRSGGVLAGAVGKAATIHFVSDGTAWYEVSRTLNL
jgi:hypothetical protein